MSQFNFQRTAEALKRLGAWVLVFAFFGAILGAIPWLVHNQNKRYANDLAERELHDQRLKDEGCVVKGREGTRAIYVCPDGSTVLAQVREVRQ